MESWNELFDHMLLDAVRHYFYHEIEGRRLFPLTEYVVDLSYHYKDLGVPLGKMFRVDIVGITAGFLTGSDPKVDFLIEIESSRNSRMQKENNRRKLCLLTEDLRCPSLQIEVPSLREMVSVSEAAKTKFSEIILAGEPLDSYWEESLINRSLIFLNPVVKLRVLHSVYPKGFKEIPIPLKRLDWWLGLLAFNGLDFLARRLRVSSKFKAMKDFWEVDDAKFFAELERRNSDFPAFAKKLYEFCERAEINAISAYADFDEFRNLAIKKSDWACGRLNEPGKERYIEWFNMEGIRLLKALATGVNIGLFEGPMDVTERNVALTGIWKRILPSGALAAGLNPLTGGAFVKKDGTVHA
jgi:hypothetical protein